MAQAPVSNAPFTQWTYFSASDSAHGAPYDLLLGTYYTGNDQDLVSTTYTLNSALQRQLIMVKNGSGTTITPGMALNWVSGYWGQRVQACPAGSPIRCFAPGYVNGSASTAIPDGAYFLAIKAGPSTILSDGTAIAINDGVTVGGTSGQVKTDYGIGGGDVYSSVAASTVLTNTVTATKYDQNYTFPANSLAAGNRIRVTGQISIPSANSTNTLATDLMLGTQAIATLTAFDPTDGGGDIIEVVAEIEIRTAGASGTMVANVTWFKNVNGTTTVVEQQLASTAIDTTAVQQLALRGTWSVASTSNQSRQDMLNISRLGVASAGLRGGIAVASAALGSAVGFRAQVNCTW